MEMVVPWQKLMDLIGPYCPKVSKKGGRGLRSHRRSSGTASVTPSWGALIEVPTMRRFAGIDPISDRIPPMRSGKRRALLDIPNGRLQDLAGTAKAHVRAKANQPFWVIKIKQYFGFQKNRRRGMARNRYRVNAITALTNPYFW